MPHHEVFVRIKKKIMYYSKLIFCQNTKRVIETVNRNSFAVDSSFEIHLVLNTEYLDDFDDPTTAVYQTLKDQIESLVRSL